MKLSEQNAQLMKRDGNDAILMLCPLPDCTHSIVIPFSETGEDDMHGPVWKRVSGATVEDLTLAPSYHLPTSCGLHGWVRDGAWVNA